MAAMTEVRVAFADTDAMGVVHHTNYIRYFEVARIDYMRSQGISYVEWQSRGVHLPLVEVQCRYRKPARFDDVIQIAVKTRREKARFIFEYELTNKKTKERLATGVTTHVPVDNSLKITNPPQEFLRAFEGALNGP